MMIKLWNLAMLGYVPAFVAPLLLLWRGGLAQRVIALQFTTILTALLLIVMTFAFDQSSFIDLPLTLALLTIPGTLLVALMLERWL